MTRRVFIKNYPNEPHVIGEKDVKREGKILLKSNFPGEFPENDIVPLYIYRGGEKGTILFLHGRGEKNLDYLRWFPKKFSEHGFHAAMMILPYHFERTPAGYRSGQLFLDPKTDVLRERFENAVVDTLTSLEYLKSNCPPPYYIMGYSFGGFIAAIAAALERVVAGLSLVVTGGDFYHITWKSFVTRVMRVRYEEDGSCNKEKCRQIHGEIYKEYRGSLESPEIELGSAPISCLEYDPLTYAKFIECPTLLTGALFDIFIPRKSTLELAQSIPNCELRWLPSGHLTSIAFRQTILKRSAVFFTKSS